MLDFELIGMTPVLFAVHTDFFCHDWRDGRRAVDGLSAFLLLDATRSLAHAQQVQSSDFLISLGPMRYGQDICLVRFGNFAPDPRRQYPQVLVFKFASLVLVLGSSYGSSSRLLLAEKCFPSQPVYLWRSTVVPVGILREQGVYLHN